MSFPREKASACNRNERPTLERTRVRNPIRRESTWRRSTKIEEKKLAKRQSETGTATAIVRKLYQGAPIAVCESRYIKAENILKQTASSA